MTDSNEKKVTTLKVLKVLLIIYTCVLIGLITYTVYGWVTGVSETNYIILGSLGAVYCCLAAEYEALKKKAKKKA